MISKLSSVLIALSKSLREYIVIYPFSSNSQINVYIIFSYSTLIYADTDMVFPIFFISLKITDFGRYGIFLPSVLILLAYNLYIFSCLAVGLYLINGLFIVVCINLNIVSIGIFTLYSG